MIQFCLVYCGRCVIIETILEIKIQGLHIQVRMWILVYSNMSGIAKVSDVFGSLQETDICVLRSEIWSLLRNFCTRFKKTRHTK